MLKHITHVFTRDSNHVLGGKTCVVFGGIAMHFSDDGELTMRSEDGKFFTIGKDFMAIEAPSEEALKSFKFADQYMAKRR